MNFDYLTYFNAAVEKIESGFENPVTLDYHQKHALQMQFKMAFEAGSKHERFKKVLSKEERLKKLSGAFKVNNSN